MPQITCCVSTCTSAVTEGAVLHAFPNPLIHFDKFRAWVTNAGIVGEDDEYIFKNRRICRLHFEEIYHYPKNRLSKLAVPTLHLPGVPAPPSASSSDQPVPIVVDVQQATCSTIRGSTECVSERAIVKPVPEKNASSTSRVSITSTLRSQQWRYMSDMELYKTVTKTRHALNRCKRAKAGLVEKLKIARKFTQSKAYELVAKNLSPAAKTFFNMQIRQSAKHPKGHRFTLDEKILALSLYKPSPKAYRLLCQMCVLPKRSTLNKLMAKVFLLPGYNPIIFQQLKKRVDKLPESHKYCTIIFDEMAIAANISYDKQNDRIKGFCDDGHEQKKCFADHALVFMVRGIFKKYKQPVSFSFCAGTTSSYSLKQQLKLIVNKTMETGLKVVSVTCDQGSTNMAAINSLMNDTRAQYIRNNKEYKGGFFEMNNNIIYPIFDPPHLIKGIRNNLLTKNLEYTLDGKKRIAKWAHIEALYRRGPGFKGLRLVPKLTARHVIPHLIPKMKVKYSTQVFSKTVSVAMGFTAGIGRIPKESTDTAELLLFFDRLFDSVNGNYNKPVNGKIYRSAVSPKSPHHKLWHKSLPILKSMRFISGQVRMVPSISSWIKTIQSFQQITKTLHSRGLRSVLLRNFNQDPLENFFGAIRAHGQRNVMPTSTSFEASFKTLLINNMATSKSVGANCENDDSHCLQSLKYFFTQNITRPLPKSVEINIDHLNIELPNIMFDSLNNEVPSVIEKCAAAAYCGGWLLNIIHKMISKNCNVCKNTLEADSEEIYLRFITLKKNTNKCILHYPSKYLLEFLIHIEIITIEILKTNCESMQLINYIEVIATSLVSLNFLKCDQHKESIKKIIFKKSIMLILFDWCKEINNLLCGKNIQFDETDPIKKLAYNYYIRHKKK